VQDKNKYNAPKYRLVVRITNTKVICQVVYSKIQGDYVLTSAYSSELPKYGVKVGLTNWAAAYCTGLLAARRLLEKVGLADKYEGVAEPDGEFYEVEALDDGPRPFKCFLDVGLHRTSTGAKIFGALKGASDGGLYIPHSEKRFPGYDNSSKTLDAEVVRDYIFGENIAEYMRLLEEDDEEAFKRQFARYISEGITADDLEEMYQKAHAAIRENPSKDKKEYTAEQLAAFKAESKKYRKQKLNLKQRNDKVKQKKAAFMRSLEQAE
jgi:large subunit ribosomal protein L5e